MGDSTPIGAAWSMLDTCWQEICYRMMGLFVLVLIMASCVLWKKFATRYLVHAIIEIRFWQGVELKAWIPNLLTACAFKIFTINSFSYHCLFWIDNQMPVLVLIVAEETSCIVHYFAPLKAILHSLMYWLFRQEDWVPQSYWTWTCLLFWKGRFADLFRFRELSDRIWVSLPFMVDFSVAVWCNMLNKMQGISFENWNLRM